MNKVNFTKWIGETLVPRLRCGNIVVMDNLRSHHGSEVREAIEAVGASIKFLLEPSIKPSQPPKTAYNRYDHNENTTRSGRKITL